MLTGSRLSTRLTGVVGTCFYRPCRTCCYHAIKYAATDASVCYLVQTVINAPSQSHVVSCTGVQWVTGWPHRHVMVHVAFRCLCSAPPASHVACMLLNLPYCAILNRSAHRCAKRAAHCWHGGLSTRLSHNTNNSSVTLPATLVLFCT